MDITSCNIDFEDESLNIDMYQAFRPKQTNYKL
jgi:hypothetical protein